MKECEGLGVDPRTIERLLKKDKGFKEAFDMAMKRFKETLEHEITRRGRDGVITYISGKNGKLKQITKYSDKLLIAAAKRHIPEYRDDSGGHDQSITAGVLVINNVAGDLNEGQWEKMNAGDRRHLPVIDIDKLPILVEPEENINGEID